MTKEAAIKLFQDHRVRVEWDNDQEKWLFSIIDIIGILTESERPRKYWSDLKKKLRTEGSEVSEHIGQLKMRSPDGKMRQTDVADTEQLLRLIQSIPSPNAEPFKIWLAKVGYERIEETEDPKKSFDRAMETYLRKGYSVNWINQRLKSIEVRKELTDEWDIIGVKKGSEYAILTDEITKAWGCCFESLHLKGQPRVVVLPGASALGIATLKVGTLKCPPNFNPTVMNKNEYYIQYE